MTGSGGSKRVAGAPTFQPRHMRVGIFTAALQELTPRSVRDADPDRAIEDWATFAASIGADTMQLSAALHPGQADVATGALLDPVANTLDLRAPFTAERAARVHRALGEHGIDIADVGYFDNMLHGDATVRATKHVFMRRVIDAAALLGVTAVCGFVGRNFARPLDDNLRDFEESFVPLLRYAAERGVTYRVEPCPMPGWTSDDSFANNLGYTPGAWIALHRVCAKHGVADQFRIHYDPSHAILMGQDSRSIFQYLRDEGYPFLIAGFHVKGQVINARGIAQWGYGGQTIGRGDRADGAPATDPESLANAWRKQTAIAEHELPGTARHDPLAYLQNRSVDWLDHQLAARELLQLDVERTALIVEHEYSPARIQDASVLAPILQASIAFTRAVDAAAASMYALQHHILASLGIPVQGHGREAFRS